MKPTFLTTLIVAATLLAAPVANACPECWWEPPPSFHDRDTGWMQSMPSMRRHHYVMDRGLPDAYRSLTNPLKASVETLTDGERLYQSSCASCHGVKGSGDGPAADALTPQPANLRHLARMSMMANDAYLYWTIAEGGEPVKTDMPAFKDTLSNDEIWSIIHYVRRGL